MFACFAYSSCHTIDYAIPLDRLKKFVGVTGKAISCLMSRHPYVQIYMFCADPQDSVLEQLLFMLHYFLVASSAM